MHFWIIIIVTTIVIINYIIQKILIAIAINIIIIVIIFVVILFLRYKFVNNLILLLLLKPFIPSLKLKRERLFITRIKRKMHWFNFFLIINNLYFIIEVAVKIVKIIPVRLRNFADKHLQLFVQAHLFIILFYLKSNRIMFLFHVNFKKNAIN